MSQSNPIICKKELKGMSFLKEKPSVESKTNLVFKRKNGTYEIITEERPITFGELFSNRYKEYYKISMEDYKYSLEFNFDCKDQVEKYKLLIDAIITIEDPILIVKENVQDIQMIFKNAVGINFKSIFREYDMNEAGAANALEKVREKVNSSDLNDIFKEKGLGIKVTDTNVKLSDKVLKTREKQKDVKNETDIAATKVKETIKINGMADLETILMANPEKAEAIKNAKDIKREDDDAKFNRILQFMKETRGRDDFDKQIIEDMMQALVMTRDTSQNKLDAKQDTPRIDLAKASNYTENPDEEDDDECLDEIGK